MSVDVFRLPDLGEGLHDAEIVAWHVAEGDHVVADQPLVAVETDKAVVEIPAPQSGRIARCHGQVGDRVEVGAVLVEFGEAGADAGAVVGTIPVAQRGGTDTRATSRAVSSTRSSSAVKASPAARRRAAELGVEIANVEGTGPGGIVQPIDVEHVAAASVAGAPSEGQPLRGVRRAMAERMSDAHRRVVPATVGDEADIHAWREGARPVVRLVRAIAAACRAEPRLHVAFDDARGVVVRREQLDLGIAMETDDGLFVPVLRDAARLDATAVTDTLTRLEAEVRARRIAPDALRGQSITLSNYGAVGGRSATMVIVPPQVAIVGAGRAYERVVMDGGVPAAHRMLPLALTFDHRVVTGVEACRFLAALIADLENPE